VSYENVKVERIEHVGVIRTNRPGVLNALNAGLALDLNDAFDELEADFPDIRALIPALASRPWALLTGPGRGLGPWRAREHETSRWLPSGRR
jgi:hypothetical protein